MSIPSILGHGVLLLGLFLAAFLRPRRPGHSAISGHPRRWPPGGSMAGVPLRILLSERSGPGAMLKDTLLTRPPDRDR